MEAGGGVFGGATRIMDFFWRQNVPKKQALEWLKMGDLCKILLYAADSFFPSSSGVGPYK